MCGRYALTATPEEVRALFGYLDEPWFPPRYNIAPTQPIAVVRRGQAGERRFELMRWGLVPAWVEEPRSFALLINARAETAADKPAFRGAMRHRRALIPASGFYEWRRGPGGRGQPFWLRPRDGGLIAFAGLWEDWLGKDGSEIRTACILTRPADEAVAAIHDRMPVVLRPEDFERWLDPRATPTELRQLLAAPPPIRFEAVEVSTRVNAAAHDGPELQQAVTLF